MSNSGPKKPASIPEWQRNYQSPADLNPSDAAPASETPASPAASEEPEPSLVEQARQLLQDESIRDASRERKIAFLRQKELPSDQILRLIDVADENPTTNSDPPTATPPNSTTPSELKTVHDSQARREATSTAPSIADASPTGAAEASSAVVVEPRREIPPIITYPEFLVKPQKPPPLVTFERLFNAAYILGGITALTYGTSKFLVEPMLETLTAARHDLATGALSDLETLNKKLESTVSHVPYIESSTKQDLYSDSESVTSDPTELFHRDVGTQTSALPSRDHSPSDESNPTLFQSNRLRDIHSSLSSLLSSTSSNYSSERLKDSVTSFQSVLDKMENAYDPFRLEFGNSLSDPAGNKNTGKKTSTENEATKFKAEIRSLKGAFLSSRNFPTARPAAPFTLPGRPQ